MTASAVSEETACAGGAHRDAEVGEGERGRVVDAVADHHDRLQSRVGAQAAYHCELVLGGPVGVDAVDVDLAADARGDRFAVAGDHRHVAHALGAQSLHDALGVRA